MPRPTHRLNLYVVPDDPDRALDELRLAAAVERLRAEGVLSGWGPGAAADRLVPGGFRRLRIDRPAQACLYGNRQGGFHARCPSCGDHLARALGPALAQWRAGRPRLVACGCGVSTDIAALDFAPPAAVGQFAVEIRDVQTTELAPDGKPWLASGIGGFVVVGSRGP